MHADLMVKTTVIIHLARNETIPKSGVFLRVPLPMSPAPAAPDSHWIQNCVHFGSKSSALASPKIPTRQCSQPQTLTTVVLVAQSTQSGTDFSKGGLNYTG